MLFVYFTIITHLNVIENYYYCRIIVVVQPHRNSSICSANEANELQVTDVYLFIADNNNKYY